MRIIKIMVAGIMSILLFSHLSGEGLAYESHTTSVTIGNATRTVHYVSYHPSENLALKPVNANTKVGMVAELSTMAKEHQAIAAINGTFFNAYDANDLQPMGAIISSRELQHFRGGEVALGITTSGHLVFDRTSNVKIIGGMNGSTVWPNTWHAWFINHLPDNDAEIVIFTPDFRTEQLEIPNFNFVIVEQGIVIHKTKNKATIPSHGFVIAYGPTQSNQVAFDRFVIGQEAEYEVELHGELASAKHLMSFSPKLVSNGHIDIDFERDGATDVKLTSNAGQRSFIGTKKDGTIVFGTVGNVTIQMLAEILAQLGLVEAVNLDGGASSGLFVNDKYITKPSRMISNSLVLVKQARTPIIHINGEEIFFKDAEPYIENGTTMVPVRGVFERLGATLEWDGSTNTVTAKRFDATVKLTQDSTTAYINNEEKTLTLAPTNIGGRIYIPLRFVSEALGADVGWDGAKYLVSIHSDIVSAVEHYRMAVDLKSKIRQEESDIALEITKLKQEEPEGISEQSQKIEKEWSIKKATLMSQLFTHLELATRINSSYNDAWLMLGVERASVRDYEKAIEAYQQVTDNRAHMSLGWAASSAGQLDIAIQAFTKATEIPELAVDAHTALGRIYRYFSIYDLEMSNKHFKHALTLIADQNSTQAEELRQLIGED